MSLEITTKQVKAATSYYTLDDDYAGCTPCGATGKKIAPTEMQNSTTIKAPGPLLQRF